MDELVETIFEQYEEYDGATLERVWQSLFKVYNQKLRKLGDNDFSVEHARVSARQRAGTLERVVKYDQEAFTKAWDYLTKSPSDDEDDKQQQQQQQQQNNNFFFRHFFTPGKRGKIRPFGGRTTSFRTLAHAGWYVETKQKTGSD